MDFYDSYDGVVISVDKANREVTVKLSEEAVNHYKIKDLVNRIITGLDWMLNVEIEDGTTTH